MLPGWSRAHVVAHVALNAEALAAVVERRSDALYASSETRDDDIADLARLPAGRLRDRFLASCTLFHEAVDRVPEGGWVGEFRRVPGGPGFPVAALLPMRHREVEVHHADLAAGYSPADWPEAFLDAAFTAIVEDRQDGPALRLRTPDGDVVLGDGDGPVVTGARADLTWWLLGRGDGAGLTGDPALPTLAPWR